ncbi:cell death activator CIDE-B isoform X1 [Marmota marmota marmota]|uniref:cell death activator CIDE-B isoform X1 n=1 Tax=Marmota marmota marmota TaxID=9994 RepID=UPI002092303B|nr:cell death activator CIDE-B isoform X1 [Marmota marmota marmota]
MSQSLLLAVQLLPPYLGPSSFSPLGLCPLYWPGRGARAGLDSFPTSSGLRIQLCKRKRHFSPSTTVQCPIQRPQEGNSPTSLYHGVLLIPEPQWPAQALKTLLLHGALTLVLEEDGTSVESEDFFQMLEDDTCLMVLELGQSWSPTRSGVLSYGLGREKPKHSKDIARITFDVYKQNPRDLFGSLNVKATFYGLYSMSCDFQGVGPKKVLRELLRWISSLLQGLGHVLLGISSTLRHVVEGTEQWQRQGRLHY